MKQTYKVPEGCMIEVTQEQNRIVFEFVPEKVEFKDGDVNKEKTLPVHTSSAMAGDAFCDIYCVNNDVCDRKHCTQF